VKKSPLERLRIEFVLLFRGAVEEKGTTAPGSPQ
jgi:hypothetical protein